MTSEISELRDRRRRDLTVAVSVLVAVVACILLVDRPASTLAFTEFHEHRAAFDVLTHIIDPLLPAASLGLAAAAVGAWAGGRAGPTMRVAVTCCLAIVLVVTLKDQAKYAFGRLWPETWVSDNPSWIANHAYGFFPFHGGRGWASFPSGHMAVIAAPAAVLWRMVPRLRPLAITLVALVAVGLYGADYHFIGDMIAGTGLGWACGLGAVELIRPRGWLTPALREADPERVSSGQPITAARL